MMYHVLFSDRRRRLSAVLRTSGEPASRPFQIMRMQVACQALQSWRQCRWGDGGSATAAAHMNSPCQRPLKLGNH